MTCAVAKHLADSFKNKTTRGKCASEPLLVSRWLGDAMDSERAAIVAELTAKMREPTPSSDNGTCASVVVLSSMFAGGTHTLDVAARVELTPNAASFDGYLRVVLSFANSTLARVRFPLPTRLLFTYFLGNGHDNESSSNVARVFEAIDAELAKRYDSSDLDEHKKLMRHVVAAIEEDFCVNNGIADVKKLRTILFIDKMNRVKVKKKQ